MLLENPKLDAVIIASSMEYNYEIAKYCAKQGKEEKHDKTANFYARPLPPMPVLLYGKHLGILIKSGYKIFPLQLVLQGRYRQFSLLDLLHLY